MQILNIVNGHSGKMKVTIRDGLRDKSKKELKNIKEKITLDKIFTLRDKSKCFDLFQNVKVYEFKMYEEKTVPQVV